MIQLESVDSCFDVNSKDSIGRTPLMLRCYMDGDGKNFNYIETFLNLTNVDEMTVNAKDHNDNTMLYPSSVKTTMAMVSLCHRCFDIDIHC